MDGITSRKLGAGGRDVPAAPLTSGRSVARPVLPHRIACLIRAEGGVPVELAVSLLSAARYTVCLPVKDEATMLPATLAALAAAMAKVKLAGACVFLLNNTSDQSAAIIRAWARRTSTNIVLAEVRLARASAPHARRIALEIGQLIAPGEPLLTTDADTCVTPDWIARNLHWLRQDTDLVCGQVDVRPAELAALVPPVRRCGELEAAYIAALRQLWHRWTGGAAPDPLLSAMGASLAISASALRAVGGSPSPEAGEDRALAQLLAERGFCVRAAADVRVTTSLRLDGRARGGVSDALRQRAVDRDPLCEEKLCPVSALQALADQWRQLSRHPNAPARFALLLGGQARESKARMRLSAVERELKVATALLEQKEVPGGQTATAK